MRLNVLGVVLACLLGPACNTALAATCVHDDTGQPVCIRSAVPVKRVLSLSPHLTEIAAYVGGVGQLLAVDDSSNHPNEVVKLPRIRQPWLASTESLLAYKPDLVLAWQSGISQTAVAQLRAAGVPVFVSEPTSVQAVAENMVAVAKLMGHWPAQAQKIDAWRAKMASLQTTHAGKLPVRVFYQVWHQPLMTLGGKHLVTEILAMCGGRNVFADQPGLSPTVNLETVISRKPSVILASGGAESETALKIQWSTWRSIPAVAMGHVHTLPPDLLVRQGPRLLEATERICGLLDSVR
ncbi:MAG TPA: cobalamin-binding protein [Limnobacter sp.]|nr:cobalamin-binding protein [Limnobacter sp.]